MPSNGEKSFSSCRVKVTLIQSCLVSSSFNRGRGNCIQKVIAVSRDHLFLDRHGEGADGCLIQGRKKKKSSGVNGERKGEMELTRVWWQPAPGQRRSCPRGHHERAAAAGAARGRGLLPNKGLLFAWPLAIGGLWARPRPRRSRRAPGSRHSPVGRGAAAGARSGGSPAAAPRPLRAASSLMSQPVTPRRGAAA